MREICGKLGNKIIATIFLCFVLSFMVQGEWGSVQAASATSKLVLTGQKDYAEAYKVLDIVNAERKKKGLAALKMDEDLLEEAMYRAAEISLYYSHTRPSGLSHKTLCTKDNGENIAIGQDDAKDVMEAWMNSPGHRANILDTRFGYVSIGIGCFRSNGVLHWVQNFGSVSNIKVASKRTDVVDFSPEIDFLHDNVTFGTKSAVSAYIGYNKSKKIVIQATGKGYSEMTCLPSPSSFTWTSSDSSIVSVDVNGTITGKKIGTATIKASCKEGSKLVVFSKKITCRYGMSDAAVTGISSAGYTYTGKAITPSVQVKYGSTVLKEGTDYKVAYTDNINAGTATVTITGCGNYRGTVTKKFTILKKDISNLVKVKSYNFAGVEGDSDLSLFAQQFVFTYDGNTLVYKTDYYISGYAWYGSREDKCCSYVKFSFTGNYSGDLTMNYFPHCYFEKLTSQTYTGEAIEPAIKVTEKISGQNKTLVLGQDYTVEYRDNTEPGTAYAVVKGMGDYYGTVTLSFKIIKKESTGGNIGGSTEEEGTVEPEPAPTRISIQDAEISGIEDREYSGEAIVFDDLAVTLHGNTLTRDEDYTVVYASNTNAGTGHVFIVGVNGYTGTVQSSFEIFKKNISAQVDTFVSSFVLESGQSPESLITLYYQGEELIAGTDYRYDGYIGTSSGGESAVNLSCVYVRFCGNYSGSMSICNFGAVKVFDIPAQIYTGEEICPKLTVVDRRLGTILLEGIDYDVEYENCKEVGTAVAILTGKGSYCGTQVVYYNIVEAEPVPTGTNLSTADVEGLTSLQYTGSPLECELTVRYDGLALVQDVDYTVEYQDNVNAGKANVVINGCGDYYGTITKSFDITPVAVDDRLVEASLSSTDSDLPVDDILTVTYNGKELIYGKDYTERGSAAELGEYKYIDILFQGNYSGTAKIRNLAFSNQYQFADREYTGEPIEPDVYISGGFTKGVDYNIVYSNNVEVGLASVEIIGKGTCCGHWTTFFRIVPVKQTEPDTPTPVLKNIADSTISGIGGKTYTGEPVTCDITVNHNGQTLSEGVDYTLTYSNNINVGTAFVKISGCGDYVGSTTIPFRISCKDLSETARVEVDSFYHIDFQDNNVMHMYDGTQELVRNTDYVCTSAYASTDGVIYCIRVKFMGNYTGAMSVYNLDHYTIKDIPVQDYTGNPIEPQPIVKDIYGSAAPSDFVEGVNYTVSYENNTDVGEAEVILTGKGGLVGTIRKTFRIAERITSQPVVTESIRGAEVSGYEDVEYCGERITFDLKVTLDGKVLEEKKDYTVTYKNNLNKGTAKIEITGCNSYKDTVIKTFKITPKDITGKVRAEVTSFAYEANMSTLLKNMKLYYGDVSLIANADYRLAGGMAGGDAYFYVDVSFIGNYSGTATIYNLEFRSLKAIPNQEYTGTAIEPEVVFASVDLVCGVDYEVTYENNVEIGTATARVTGIGTCCGVREITFLIVEPKQEETGGGGNEDIGGETGGGGSEDIGGETGGGGNEDIGGETGGGGSEDIGGETGGGGNEDIGGETGGGGSEDIGGETGGGGSEDIGGETGGGGSEDIGGETGGGGSEDIGGETGGGGNEDIGGETGGGGNEDIGGETGGGGNEDIGGETGGGEQPTTPESPVGVLKVTGRYNHEKAGALLKLVNEERERNGLPAHVPDRDLWEAAQLRSAEIAVRFQDGRPNGKSYTSVCGKVRMEKKAAMLDNPEDVFAFWMQDNGFNTILSGRTGYSIGIGCFEHNNIVYWVLCCGFDIGDTYVIPASGTETVTVGVETKPVTFGGNLALIPDTISVGDGIPFETSVVNWGCKDGSGANVKCLPDIDSYTFVSSAPDVISFDSSGVIRGLKKGTATVSVLFRDSEITLFTKEISVGDDGFGGEENPKDDKDSDAVKVGSIHKVSGIVYKVMKNKTVACVKPANKNKTSYTVPDKVKIKGKNYKVVRIESRAFKSCGKVTKVTIGKNVKEIGKEAFYKCKKLKKINIKTTKLSKVGKSAFKNIDKKAKFTLPASRKKAYKKLLNIK